MGLNGQPKREILMAYVSNFGNRIAKKGNFLVKNFVIWGSKIAFLGNYVLGNRPI
jgi:cytochrome c-type biogenesis protein CcmH/NrfF